MPFIPPIIAAIAASLPISATAFVGAVATGAAGLTAGVAAGATLLAAGAVAAGAVAAGIGATLAVTALNIGLSVGLNAIVSALTPKAKLQSSASQIAFKADINGGVPYIIGRTGVGGSIIFADTSNEGHNKWLHYVSVLSHGPITAIEKFYANNVPVAFALTDPYNAAYVGLNYRGAWSNVTQYQIDDGVLSGGTNYIAVAPSLNIAPPNASYWAATTINSSHAWLNKMWQVNALGAQPSTALPASSASGSVPEWDSAHKLSGLAAARWSLVSDATAYGAGTPKPTWVAQGPGVYDPRLDSTYPGGSGAHRSNDETTWTYSQNPFLHALSWLIGRKNNGIKVLGLGLAMAAIDTGAYVAAANVADANGWKVGGQVFSTDSKWQVLTAMCQAGGGAPMRLGAKVSCMVNTPVVSIATLTGADAIGPVTIQGTTKRADRINRVIPSYRSETHDWQIVPANAVEVSAYQTTDGGKRTKAIEYPLVQGANDCNQAAQLARYAIEDSREFGPIVIPAKPQWMGLQPGDAVTLSEPEWGMSSQLCLVMDRKIDPTQGVPTLTLRSETTGKHAFALGQTGTPPPDPALTGVDLTVVPAPGAVWTAAGTTLSSGGQQVPAIVVTGAIDDPTSDQIVVEYSEAGAGVWNHLAAAAIATKIPITDVKPNTSYDVRVRNLRSGAVSAPTTCTGSPVTTGNAIANTIVGQGALATNNTVSTGLIDVNAVTNPQSAYTSASSGGIVNTGTTLQTVSITTAGGTVDIIGAFVSDAVSTGGGFDDINIQIKRGSTVIYNEKVLRSLWDVGSSSYIFPIVSTAVAVNDNPGAGTYTYTMVGTTVLNFGTVHARFLSAKEFKR